jgi:hypothetical protein
MSTKIYLMGSLKYPQCNTEENGLSDMMIVFSVLIIVMILVCVSLDV